MSSIFGIVSRSGIAVGQEQLQAMKSALDHWGATDKSEKKSDAIAFGSMSLNSEDKQIVAYQDYVLLADVTLFNQATLIQKLGLPPSERPSDAFLVLQAYLKWGNDCPNYLNGEFAFVIYHTESKTCFAARDHHGIKPLYYYLNENYFVFATEMKGILSLPYVSKEEDEQYITDFICRIWLDNTQTLYRSIKRFPAAHSAVISNNGIQLSKYWKLENRTVVSYKKESDYVDAFEEKLKLAIAARSKGEEQLGTELSGGLDSSLVSVLLNQQKGQEVSAYSYVLPDHLEGKSLHSEVDKIKAIVQHAGIRNLELLTDETKGLLDSLAWNLKMHDEPPFEFNPLFRDSMFKKLHEKGQRILFSGFGGDEMLSSQASGYLKQLYLEGKKDLVKEELRALSKRKNKSELLLRISLMLKMYLGDRWFKQFVKSFQGQSNIEKKLPNRPIQKTLYKKLNIEDRFAQYQRRYTRNGDFITDQIRRMQETHVALRLEYQAIAARSFQVQYRYPLLDVDLIEFYLGLPTELKARNGNGRYIFKKVMERHLPKSMVWKESKKASSNPQLLSRTLNDGKNLEKQLFSIPNNHPLWNYLDRNKLKSNRQEFKNWNQSTTDFVYLMLADKLEQG